MAQNTTQTGTPNSRPQKINEALKTLDEAISQEGADLSQLLTSDYRHLKDAVSGMAPKISDAFKKASDQTMSYVKDYSNQGMQKSREFANQVDSQVRRNPWAVIGGVAFSSLALGYVLGRRGGTESKPSEIH